MDYRYGSHTVYEIEYHLVWVTKYRYKVLIGDVGQRMFGIENDPVKARPRKKLGHHRAGDGIPDADLLLACFQSALERIDWQAHFATSVAMRRSARR